ncbi:F-box protein At2g05970-like [Silene latifolia]|uniref:F-box protein At2g05970-like n=1 Tax=Silene latifolia TaxID=37657 RepID=UPI003D780F45
MAADWSMLPLDVVGVIALKLQTFEDFIKFSVACRWWNRASSSVKHQWKAKPVVPWLLLAENTKDNPDCVRKIFNLSNNKRYNLYLPETFGARCWGSPYGWIAMIDRNYDVILLNPITKAQFHFPCLKPLDCGTPPTSGESYESWFLRCFANRLIVLKVPQNNNYEFVVLVVYEYYQGLAFARQGDQQWTPIFVKSEVKMVDLVAIEDKVFALYEDGSIVSWNVDEFNALQLIKPADYSLHVNLVFVKLNKSINQIYMAQSGNELLLVLRYKDGVGNADNTDFDHDIVYRTIGFEVYKLKPKDKIWEITKDLGEVALVVGGNSSMCVATGHAEGLQRNCIYFTDDDYVYWRLVREKGGHDTGFYDIKTDVLQFYEGDDMRSSFSPPTFFIPQL